MKILVKKTILFYLKKYPMAEMSLMIWYNEFSKHSFNNFYTKEYLVDTIIQAHNVGATILIGGCEDFGYAYPISKGLFWINSFSRSGFIVVYKRIFREIMRYEFGQDDIVENILSSMTSHKITLYPAISISNPALNIISDYSSMAYQGANLRLKKLQESYIRFINPGLDEKDIPLL